MARKKIAVIGVGKISQDQHLPVIDKGTDFEVAATVSTRGLSHRGLPVFETPAELYREMPEVKVVAICTPPGVRHAFTRDAIDAGKDVLLEKPPTPTISEFDDLVAYAGKKKRVLFQTWHSRYNEAVDATRKILKREGVRKVFIDWRESVRKWHPGQDWVWEPGGFGVFDPGMNALAILTEIMPFPVLVESAELTYPANRQTPSGARVVFKGGPGTPGMAGDFDWLHDGDDIWTIHIETLSGSKLDLERHGVVLRIDGEVSVDKPQREYEKIYKRFAKLVRTRESDADGTPLRLATDIFAIGRRVVSAPFEW